MPPTASYSVGAVSLDSASEGLLTPWRLEVVAEDAHGTEVLGADHDGRPPITRVQDRELVRGEQHQCRRRVALDVHLDHVAGMQPRRQCIHVSPLAPRPLCPLPLPLLA